MSGLQIVGAPSLSFTYSGRGTSRAVFARIVDTGTGTVLGNIVTPIPVTLDDEEYTVSLPLADVVYSSAGISAASLTLQITSSATAFANPSSGEVEISDITISLPTRSMLTQV